MDPIIFLGKSIKVHPSWNSFLSDEVKEEIKEVEQKLILQTSDQEDITPKPELVFRFLGTDLDKVRVLILGQDPYPQKGVATGRAFEVGTLKSWSEPFGQSSLRHIILSINKSLTKETTTFSDLRKRIENQTFKILNPPQLFNHWEKEGVLMLNTSLTCEIGKPNFHVKIWQKFTSMVLAFLSSRKDIIWFLWGKEAQRIAETFQIEKKLENHHPSRVFKGRDLDFLHGTSNPFEKTKDIIDWTGFKDNQNPNNSQTRMF